MVAVNKGFIRTCIDSYIKGNPKGRDLTAFVLSRLGRLSVEKYARAAHKGRLDEAERAIGTLVKELLLEMYRASRPLREVKVDPAAFPDLVGWVSGYMTYEVG